MRIFMHDLPIPKMSYIYKKEYIKKIKKDTQPQKIRARSESYYEK